MYMSEKSLSQSCFCALFGQHESGEKLGCVWMLGILEPSQCDGGSSRRRRNDMLHGSAVGFASKVCEPEQSMTKARNSPDATRSISLQRIRPTTCLDSCRHIQAPLLAPHLLGSEYV